MSNTAHAIVARIETPRLVVRSWNPEEAATLKEAVDASIDHLKPWMPWAGDEPQSIEKKVALIQRFRSNFDGGRDFTYAIFDRQEQRVLGGCGLHTRLGAGAREIGYWIRPDAIDAGLATEAAGALTRVGFECHRVRLIEIHCEPANVASSRVAEKLGYTLRATVPDWVNHPASPPRDTMIWMMTMADYPESPAAGADIEAYDGGGVRVL